MYLHTTAPLLAVLFHSMYRTVAFIHVYIYNPKLGCIYRRKHVVIGQQRIFCSVIPSMYRSSENFRC